MNELNFIKRFETIDVECFNFNGKALLIHITLENVWKLATVM